MSFLIPSDFDNIEYNIANNDNTGMPDFIQAKEDYMLTRLLGRSFYQELKTQMALLPAEWVKDNETGYAIDDEVVYGVQVFKSLQADNLNHVPAEDAWWTVIETSDWLKFVKGDSYKINNKSYYWDGLKALLIGYVYAMWLRATTTKHSANGVVMPNVDNATVMNPGDKMIIAYNNFSRIAGSYSSQENTLYGYLFQTGKTGLWDITFDDTTYEDFLHYLDDVFVAPGRMNFFNI